MKLLILALLVTACTNEFHLGERVTNGVCTGVVINSDVNYYQLSDWTCKGVSLKYMKVPKTQLRSLEQ